MIYLYGQQWFGNFSLLGVNMRELFQLQPVNLSIAVWVGFLALFGIAVDDGVVMATYLKQRFAEASTRTIEEIRSEEHTSELQSRGHLVCRLLLEKKKHNTIK